MRRGAHDCGEKSPRYTVTRVVFFTCSKTRLCPGAGGRYNSAGPRGVETPECEGPSGRGLCVSSEPGSSRTIRLSAGSCQEKETNRVLGCCREAEEENVKHGCGYLGSWGDPRHGYRRQTAPGKASRDDARSAAPAGVKISASRALLTLGTGGKNMSDDGLIISLRLASDSSRLFARCDPASFVQSPIHHRRPVLAAHGMAPEYFSHL